jgi:hypothetical protein
MSITNTDLATAAAPLKEIRDYAAKLEILDKISGQLENITSTSFPVQMQELIKETSLIRQRLEYSTGTLNNIVTVLERGISKKITDLDKSLADIFKTPKAEVKESITADVAEVKPIDIGTAPIVEAIQKSVETQAQTNNILTAQLQNAEKTHKEEKTAALLGKKTEEKKAITNKEKLQPPKLPFSFKQFMGGLGTILRGILNPVALITAFVQKMLPFFILAAFFLRGFWQGIGQELRDKISAFSSKVGKAALIIFGLFKGVPLFIKGLQVAYYTASIMYLSAKWVKDMVVWALNLKNAVDEGSRAKSLFLFKRGIAVATFILDKLRILFETALAVMKFVIYVAAIGLVVTGFLLLVVGIFWAFKKVIGYIGEIFDTIGNIFVKVAGGIVNIFKTIPDAIVSAAVSLLKGFVKVRDLLRGKQEGTVSQESTKQETNTVEFSKNMERMFNESIKKITEPLNAILTNIRLINLRMNMGLGSFGVLRALPNIVNTMSTNNNVTSTGPTVQNNDNVHSQIDTSNYTKVSSTPVEYTSILKAMHETLKSINEKLNVKDTKAMPNIGIGGR